MDHASARPADGLEEALKRYADPIYRTCLVMLGNPADAEDAVQETMMKYLQKAPRFETARHERAWLLKVAANVCRDQLRFRGKFVQLDPAVLEKVSREEADTHILEALMAVPERFRLVLTLHYVEGYTTAEIAKMIGRTPSAVKMRLQKGRKLLEEAYGKE